MSGNGNRERVRDTVLDCVVKKSLTKLGHLSYDPNDQKDPPSTEAFRQHEQQDHCPKAGTILGHLRNRKKASQTNRKEVWRQMVPEMFSTEAGVLETPLSGLGFSLEATHSCGGELISWVSKQTNADLWCCFLSCKCSY